MTKATNIAAIVMTVLVLAVLAVTQWLPVLFFLPVAGALYLVDWTRFSVDQDRARANRWPK